MMRTCALFLCLVTFISCTSKNKKPAGVLEPGKMQAVLWDVIKADALTAEMTRIDSAKNAAEENLKMQRAIFSMHRVTKEEFEKSYRYYKENPGQLKVIMDSMIIQGERDRIKNYTVKPVDAN